MEIKKKSVLINFILFQVGWIACVWGAANNYGWLGPILVAITVTLQLCLLTERYVEETRFVIICGITGFVLETVFILGKVYLPVGQMDVRICPPWMAALWFNFAMLVSISLSWLKGKYLLAAILGGFTGPVAYWGGEKLGAITVADAFWEGYFPLALLWALVLPFLIHMHSRLTTRNVMSSAADQP
jgi:hypothetical protein